MQHFFLKVKNLVEEFNKTLREGLQYDSQVGTSTDTSTSENLHYISKQFELKSFLFKYENIIVNLKTFLIQCENIMVFSMKT